MTLPEGAADALAAALAAAPEGPLGVAVSGGGDSVALLLLLQRVAAGRALAAVTVDHGLRAGSAGEAAAVAALCAGRGIPHEVRRWGGWDGRGNLQDRARRARLDLIAAWAKERGIGGVALGHTLDDQAETVLMRLARGSGVDGLSAMAPVREAQGVTWLRPLLGIRRAALRAWLADEGVGWAEDPTNADPRFDRVRARAALPVLAGLGLGVERLGETARAMGRARAALEVATGALAEACLLDGGAGDVSIERAPFAAAPEEIRLRLLAGALSWVSGAVYRPRLASLEAALAAIEADRVGAGLTLHGCVLRARPGGRVAIRRELARMAPPVPAARRRWDGRWELLGPLPEDAGLTIGALGREGLARVRAPRPGLAREALAATPAIWRDGTLVSAPVADTGSVHAVRRFSAGAPPWAPGAAAGDSALNPDCQGLC